MTAEHDARRIAAGPAPSELVRGAARPAASASPEATPYDPLHLCVFATVALLGWAAGPVALLAFAVVGFVGYWRARRAGLRTSRCFLRDTRLVLLYLAALGIAAVWGSYVLVARLFGA